MHGIRIYQDILRRKPEIKSINNVSTFLREIKPYLIYDYQVILLLFLNDFDPKQTINPNFTQAMSQQSLWRETFPYNLLPKAKPWSLFLDKPIAKPDNYEDSY